MANLLYGLNIAANTLRAQSSVLNVIAHNVANANTPGYSRQEVMLTQISDQTQLGLRMSGSLNIGSGVEAAQVSRSRFVLYDEIYRKENQELNFSTKSENLLAQVEILFDEPSDRSLAGVIDSFFNGWLDVANQPQNTAGRQSLASVGEELTDRMKRIYNAINVMREDIDSEIAAIPAQINMISQEIADLNVSIRKTEVQGATANDLRDRRDTLVDELSKYTEVRAVEQKDGTTTILIGSQVVVEQDSASKLEVETGMGEQGQKYTIVRAQDGTSYEPKKGVLGALINVRDVVLVDILGQLNHLAEAIVTTVNFEHRNGFGLDGVSGRNFFDPNYTKAFNITLSKDIEDLTNIAVSGDGSKGDNSNALAINELKSRRVVDDQFTINEYYNSVVTNLGVISRDIKSNRTNQELLVSQIDNSRESVKGVSIDEEMVSMIQTQRIYQSASRVITVLDEMLQEVINLK